MLDLLALGFVRPALDADGRQKTKDGLPAYVFTERAIEEYEAGRLTPPA